MIARPGHVLPEKLITHTVTASREHVRLMEPGDLDFALALADAEGWVASRPLLECLLAHDPEGCFVAEVEGERVAMVTTTRFERTGWIGNLVVRSGVRGGGIGTRLFARALDVLRHQGAQTVRLEADPPGVRIYQRAGFASEFESLRFRTPLQMRLPGGGAEPLTEADWPALRAFDAACFGDDRGRLLAMLLERSSVRLLLRSDRGIAGYLLVVPSLRGARLGPIVAVDVEAARDLLGAALSIDAALGGVTLGIPAANREGVALYRSLGFEPAAACTRMVFGDRAHEGLPERIFGIANGAIG